MAITKIHAVKHTVGKSISYICNEAKTKENFIHCYRCTPETAELEFELTAQHARSNGVNRAYHMIISFPPGEVSAVDAFLLSKKWADEVLGGKYEYVLATHTDREHIHSHVIFNAVSFKGKKRFRCDKRAYYRMSKIAERLCNEAEIKTLPYHGRKYDPKTRHAPYVSKKSQAKKAIDDAIFNSFSYEEFTDEMRKRDYEIREDEYIWFRRYGDKRFTKGDTIGRAYTRDSIRQRIRGRYRFSEVSLLIDIESSMKRAYSDGFREWARINNLKEASKTVNFITEHGITCRDELDERIAELKEQRTKKIDEINELDERIAGVQKKLEIKKEFDSVKDLAAKRKTAKNKAQFDRENALGLQKYKKLKNALLDIYKSNHIQNTRQIENELADLQRQRDELYDEFTALDKETTSFCAAKYNLDAILRGGHPQFYSDRENDRVTINNEKKASEEKHERVSVKEKLNEYKQQTEQPKRRRSRDGFYL